MQGQISNSIPQNTLLNQQHITTSGLDLLNHAKDITTLFLQNPIHLRVITHHDALFDVGFRRRYLELDDGDLGVLHAGGPPSRVANLLVEDEPFHEFGVVHGAAKLLHDLDVAEVNHVGLCVINDGENSVDGEGREERGVLAHDLAVERGAGGLHKRVAVGELHGHSHGSEDVHSLDGGLVEGVGDDGGVDAMGE